ncbi:MAG: hypothetical protein ABI833_23230 [Acidobacteriota bacterium]
MQPAKILLIEDNEADIELFRFALDQQGEEYERFGGWSLHTD